MKILSELGYNVKFLGENFYRHEPYTKELQKMGIEVLYGPYYANNYQNWLKQNGNYFDYVFFNRPHITTKFIDVVTENCGNFCPTFTTSVSRVICSTLPKHEHIVTSVVNKIKMNCFIMQM